VPSPAQPIPPFRGLTAVDGLKVGHHTLKERPTGCTVVLAEKGAVAGVDVRGGAPGTRDTDLLNPVASAGRIHGITFAGGSAFGLTAADGVVRYLEERGAGVRFGGHTIPLVPSAILFDLAIGDGKIRPDANCGYTAAKNATADAVAEGNVGAGAGATVGKLAGRERAMKAGIGTAEIRLRDGVVVAALAAVNAVGDIVDPATGKIVAGVRTVDGKSLADVRTLMLQQPALRPSSSGDDEAAFNTTLGVVATNATLTKTQATRVAQIAHGGLARAIVPVHTGRDGDAVFALATGTLPGVVDADLVGWAAAEAIAQAIVRAARAATSIPNYPAARDMK
jgi:L-aminopeptidase/D-esterase-like protein